MGNAKVSMSTYGLKVMRGRIKLSQKMILGSGNGYGYGRLADLSFSCYEMNEHYLGQY